MTKTTYAMTQQAQALIAKLDAAWNVATAAAIKGASWERATRLSQMATRAAERRNRRVTKLSAGK